LPRKEYEWVDGAPPRIAPHSLAKHRILREYAGRYVQTVTQNPRQERLRLAIVDGFAGGGEYEDATAGCTVPGSPQILIDAVHEAEGLANVGRRKPIQVDATFHFVEMEPRTVACLRAVLARRPDWNREAPRVHIHEGSFEQHLEPIIADIQRQGRIHRAIFVLDQYGYTAVPLPLIRRIFEALPNAEIFLTIAVGWITAYLPTIADMATKLGLPREVLDHIARDEGTAFDVDDPNRRPDLFAVQRLLQQVFTRFGSIFYTPFFIVSRDSHRPYWFLHLAKSFRAHDVVTDLHWRVQNHFEHFGAPGIGMLGYDPLRDRDLIRQLPLFRFDERARGLTRDALMVGLPERMHAQFADGTSFGNLMCEIANDMPATEAQVAQIISDLCREGELSKRGAAGQRRAPETLPRVDDLIELPRQLRLSIPRRS